MAQIKSFKQVIVEEEDRKLVFEVLDKVLSESVKNDITGLVVKSRESKSALQMEIDFNEPNVDCTGCDHNTSIGNDRYERA